MSKIKNILIFLICSIRVQTLANKCPFVQGSSVYKARTIWNNFRPDAIFDDRVLCIPQAQEKSTDGNTLNNGTVDIDSLSMATIGNMPIKNSPTAIENTKGIAKEIILYPNPATDYIVINSPLEKGSFILMNMIGQEILTTELTNKKTTVKLPLLANATYSYKLIYNNEIYHGKIAIKK